MLTKKKVLAGLGALTLGLSLAGSAFATSSSSTPITVSGGPVVLMGIDAEDGGAGGHGPNTVYQNVVSSVLSKVTNGGSGILVIGDSGTEHNYITSFWEPIGQATGQTLTYVNDGDISTHNFSGYAMIAVISDEWNTYGGLTQSENDSLTARQNDIADFVNSGGGLLGFSSQFTNPYGYLAGVGAFTFNFPAQYDNITPTVEGLSVGITDELDICCWHDEYTQFPSFLQVLATNPLTGNASAIGGASVYIPPVNPNPELGFKKITGGGFVGKGKSRNSYGFNAQATEEGLKVNLEYNDHQDSTNPIQVKVKDYAKNVTEVKNDAGEVIGVEFDILSHVRSANEHERTESMVRVRVVDNGEPGTNDEFSLQIKGGVNAGYSSESTEITSGNIQIH